MVSAQENGVYRIYIMNPSGDRKLVYAATNALAGPGGSPDGAIANTPEKWQYVAPSAIIGGSGYSLVFTVQPTGADTLDASDASWSIPVVVNGQMQSIGNSAGNGLGNDNFEVTQALADTALVASVEATAAVYRAKNGVSFQVGGGPIFYTYEDDTA